jgi:hypothetical protein
MSDVERIATGLNESFQRYRARVGRVTSLAAPNPSDDDLTPLTDAINNTEAFPSVSGWWIWARGRQNVLTASWLAKWAFPSWRQEDHLRETAEEIYRVITTRAAPVSLYTAIWGAEVAEPVDIDRQVSMFPFGSSPSRAVDEFNREGPGNPIRFLGAYRHAVAGPPTLALRHHISDFPFLSDSPERQSLIAQYLIDGSNTTCLSLTVFGTLTSIVDLSWFEYDERVLDDVWFESNRFWRMPEVLPAAVGAARVNVQSLVEAHAALATLSNARRHALLSSMKRFDLSLARRDVGDQAIDLCTAFEQLLGSGGEGGISWSNGLRCAALIGGDDTARLRTRDIVHTLYRIRNNWVHGGAVMPAAPSKTMGKIPPRDLVLMARSVYSDLVRVLTRIDADIDWFALETAGRLP